MVTQHKANEAALRQRIDAIVEGLRTKDLDALGRLYTTDVVSFDIEPPLQHLGVAAKLNNWAKVFHVFESVEYELRDLMFTVGDGVGFAHGFGRVSGTLKNGTVARGMWVRATFCFTKVGSEWLVAHDQVSVPFDLATGKGVVDLVP